MSQKIIYPLSNPQKLIWSTEKMYPNTSISNNAGTLRLNGILDFKVMEQAINAFIRKNDSIRLRISQTEEQPVQYISPYEFYKVDILDFGDLKNKEAFYQWEENITCEPFDLLDNNLFYFAMIKINEKESAIYCKAHHIITDAWSIILLGNKIFELYYNIINLHPIDYEKYISYIEYVFDEENYLKSERFQKNKAFWEQKFSSIPDFICLKPYNPLSINTKAMRKGFVIDHQTSEKINMYCKEHKTSPFMFFMSVLSVYLCRVTGKNDIAMGTTVLNRSNMAQKETVGMFATVVPVRLSVDDAIDFDSYLQAVSQELKLVLKNQRYPLAYILNAYREKNKTSGNLFDIGLTYHTAKFEGNQDLKGVKLRWHAYNHQTNSLNIHISDREDNENYILNFDYRIDIFSSEEIVQMYSHIYVLLQDILQHSTKAIWQMNILSNEEQLKIFNRFNSTKLDYPRDKTIHELFEDQVKRMPDRVAVICEEKELSYLELNQRANQLARVLRKKGVKSESVVGIMVKRSLEMIVGILGILKAGGAYLPIDPSYPSERIEFILKDSDTHILITDSPAVCGLTGDLREILDIKNTDLFQDMDVNDLLITMNPSQLAYLIYTSGSTGKPKGTLIEHRSVCNFIESISRIINFTSYKTILAVTTISFDIFVLETLVPLAKGLKVVITTENEQVDPILLGNLIQLHAVELLQITPSRMQILLKGANHVNCLKSIKVFMIGGEPFPKTLLGNLKGFKNARIFNMYGPTETTVWSTVAELTEEENITIGSPIGNTQAFILDNKNRIQGIGMQGELCISGDGLARGYLNQLELTFEKFVPHPFIPDKKMYRTGDLAKWLPDGNIEFLGRKDHQVKVRGFRIELGEIENQIMKVEGVRESVAAVKKDLHGSPYLCAYYVSDTGVNVDHVRTLLNRTLPRYMIPQFFMPLQELPLTPNGKINRNALPEIDILKNFSSEFVAPRNETEEMLSTLWKEILHVDKVGVNESFYTVGGDSLKAAEMSTGIANRLGFNLPLQKVVELQTIDAISQCLLKNMNKNCRPDLPKNIALLKQGNAGKQMFMVHAGSGGVISSANLASHITSNYTCWGISYNGENTIYPNRINVSEKAAQYIEALQKIQPEGPYTLFGWCVGGIFVYEMARQLLRDKHEIDKLFIVTSPAPGYRNTLLYQFDISLVWEKFLVKYLFKNKKINKAIGHCKSIREVWETACKCAAAEECDMEGLRARIENYFGNRLEISRAIPNFHQADLIGILKYMNTIRTISHAGVVYKSEDNKSLNVNTHLFNSINDTSVKNTKRNIKKWKRLLGPSITVWNQKAAHFTLMYDEPERLAKIMDGILK